MFGRFSYCTIFHALPFQPSARVFLDIVAWVIIAFCRVLSSCSPDEVHLPAYFLPNVFTGPDVALAADSTALERVPRR